MNDLLIKLKQLDLLSAANIMGMRTGMLAGKFLLSLFIVRFIGLEALGIYGLVSGTSAIVQMAARFGVFSNISRIAVNQPLSDLTRNLYHYGIGCLFLYLLSLPFVIAAGWYFDQMEIVVLSYFVVIFEHVSGDAFVLTNNLNKPKLANMLLTLQSAGWIYLFMLLAFLIPSLRTLDAVFFFWILGGLAITIIAAVITRDWPWKQAFAEKISLSWYNFHIVKSWRIYASDIIGTVILYLDRYLISIFLTLELVGVYILFWQVINAICNLVGASVLQVSMPRMIAAHKENDIGKFNMLVRKSAYRSMGMTALLSLASALVVPYLIGMTNQPMAMEYLPLFRLMLFALLFRMAADICSYTLFSLHRDDLVLLSGFLKLFMSAVVGTLMLLWIGIYSVVVITIITGSIAVLYTSFALKQGKAQSI